jgi:hypothetical protein
VSLAIFRVVLILVAQDGRYLIFDILALFDNCLT